MASSQNNNTCVFIRGCGGDDAQKTTGVSTKPKTRIDASSNETTGFIEYSPPVSEPSRDRSRSLDDRRKPNLLRRLLTRSLNFEPSEITPIVDGGQMNEQVEDGDVNCCTRAYKCYKNSVVMFRNSAFLPVMQLLFSSIPVSSIVMGVIFAENCPKVSFLPVFGAVVGLIGLIFMAVWMYASCSSLHGTPCSNRQRVAMGAALFVVMLMTIIDAVFIFNLSPSFDPSSNEYCNETFYTYAFYKEIASVVIVVLSAIIYLPGSRHILCCHDCEMRSPPNAFYHSM